MTKKDKHNARLLTYRFIEEYCNILKVCQRCGNPNAQIHHGDYSDIYSINLLCNSCHKKLHKNEILQPIIINLKSEEYYYKNKKIEYLKRKKTNKGKNRNISLQDDFDTKLVEKAKEKNMRVSEYIRFALTILWERGI